MLSLLLILAIVAGLLPLGADFWWGFELVSHFRLQIVVAAAVLLGLAIAFRKPALALGLAVMAGINAWPLLPYLATGEAPRAGQRLVVLDINVEAFNPDHARVLRAIRAADADLVTIIELSPSLAGELDVLADDYPYRLLRPAANPFGIGVLSRYPLAASLSFELGPGPGLQTDVELPFGRITLLAAHPMPPVGPTRARERNRQLRELAERASRLGEPLLICGDFNLSPYSPYFRRFEQQSHTANVRLGLGLGFSWPSFMPLLGIPIDHCFRRGPLVPAAVERMEPTGSDHYPVRVTLRWQGSQ